jgi:SHS family lactate transporter-like MFS transporter
MGGSYMTNTTLANPTAKAGEPWWKEPTRDQWRTLLATWAGWCLDVFDFFLLILVLSDVAKTFDVSLVAMGTVLTGTLLCRLLGGIVFGTWGDRVGRRLPLMVSIATFAIFSALSGVMPDFFWFFVCRLLFGFGMGGEWAAGTSLAMESWPARSRGIASGILQGGYPCGYFLATIAYFVIYPLWGWRVLFVLGLLPALLLFYIRSKVKESPVFLERQAAMAKAGTPEKGISFLRLFKPDLLGTTLHAFVLMIGAMLSQFCLSALWPTYLTKELNLTIGQRTVFLILLNVGSLVGYWCAGALSEKIGRRMALALFALAGILVVPLYSMSTDFTLVMIGGMLMGFFAVGFWGVIPAYLAERFPTSVRGVGPGASFSVGAGIGSFGPTLQTLLVQNGGFTLGQAIAMGTGASLIIVAVLVFLGPESKGRVFTVDD